MRIALTARAIGAAVLLAICPGSAHALDPMTCTSTVIGDGGEVGARYTFSLFSKRIAKRVVNWRPPADRQMAHAPHEASPGLRLTYDMRSDGAPGRLTGLYWRWPMIIVGYEPVGQARRVIQARLHTRFTLSDGASFTFIDEGNWNHTQAFNRKLAGEIRRRPDLGWVMMQRLDDQGRVISTVRQDLTPKRLRDSQARLAHSRGRVLVERPLPPGSRICEQTLGV